MSQVNNLVSFSGKLIGSEEFLNRIIEALDITTDRRPKGRLRKMESKAIEKIECVPNLKVIHVFY